MRTIDTDAFNGAANLITMDLFNKSIWFMKPHLMEWGNCGFCTRNTIKSATYHSKSAESWDFVFIQQFDWEYSRSRPGNSTGTEVWRATYKSWSLIGLGFMIDFQQLSSFDLPRNICVDSSWLLQYQEQLKTIRLALSTCFGNSSETPDDVVRIFKLKLVGALTLYDENGNEIFRI